MKPFVVLCLAVMGSAGVLSASGRVPDESPAPSSSEPSPPARIAPGPRVALILRLPDRESLDTVAAWLEGRPSMGLSVVLPDDLFKPSSSPPPSPPDSTLRHITGGALEPLLSISGEPVLPLVLDSNVAFDPERSSAPPPGFSWPEDVRAHLGEAADVYRAIFGKAPSSIELPGGASSAGLAQELGRFRLGAALGRPAEVSRSCREGSVAVVLPKLIVWSEEVRALLKTGDFPAGAVFSVEVGTAPGRIPWSDLAAALEEIPGSGGGLLTLSKWISGGSPVGSDPCGPADYSAWIGTPLQNAAWRELGRVREAAAVYQNSGRARLPRLDAALREIRVLEGGEFFALLADPERRAGPSAEAARRQFVATLSNVYRLIETPPPAGLETLFSLAGESAAAPGGGFFSEGPDWFRWGEVPSPPPPGEAPPPALDLDAFEVRWDSDSVELTFTLQGPELPAEAAYATTDAYIDLNHVLGAGCEVLLPGREARVAPEDGWEYGVAVRGREAVLYRALSPSEFTKVQTIPVETSGWEGRFSVRVPRTLLRGNPRNWGYVAALSPGNPAAGKPGGARDGESGTQAPSFVDLIPPADRSPEEILSGGGAGRAVIIPALRP